MSNLWNAYGTGYNTTWSGSSSTITTSGTGYMIVNTPPTPRPAPESELDWLKRRVREITELVPV